MESNYWLLWLDPGVKLYEQDGPSLLNLCAYCLLQAIVNLKTLRKLYLNCDFKMLPINSLCSLFWFLLLWNLLDPDAIKLLPLFRARELKIMLFKYPPSVSPCLSPSWWSPPPTPESPHTYACHSLSGILEQIFCFLEDQTPWDTDFCITFSWVGDWVSRRKNKWGWWWKL